MFQAHWEELVTLPRGLRISPLSINRPMSERASVGEAALLVGSLPRELTIIVSPLRGVTGVRKWDRDPTSQAGLQACRGARELCGETEAHPSHGCTHYGRKAVA